MACGQGILTPPVPSHLGHDYVLLLVINLFLTLSWFFRSKHFENPCFLDYALHIIYDTKNSVYLIENVQIMNGKRKP